MSSNMPNSIRTTAAWRISLWPTLAFAIGTAVTFFITFLIVSNAIQERDDVWLRGEAETMAQVAADTPLDSVYNKIVGEVAELAEREVIDESSSSDQKLNAVFFMEEDPANRYSPLWVGPDSKGAFIVAIQKASLDAGVPKSIVVDGWPLTFRVVALRDKDRTIYLGLYSHGDMMLLYALTVRFLALWVGTVLLGFLISYLAARRTLSRVESITETVAQIGSEELGKRLPEPQNSDEISMLAHTFNHMLGRIQSSVNQLRNVTDTVAHDLKSPVTSIRATLESALCDESNYKLRDSIGEAIEGMDRLLEMLNTILDVAEAQGGALRLDRRSIDLSVAVRHLVDLYHPAMSEKNHEVVADIADNVVVDADPALLNRVISNLLENELTHLPPGCRINIRLGSERGLANLVIEDNGPGFSPDIMNRAFERFVKGENSRGHGLGLAFVDAVVQSHGGTAKISGRAEGGAVITMLLPLGVPQPA
jgi:signal transduction histidine kinase